MERTGGYRGASTAELLERDHELRASLCGIEAVAVAVNEQRDRLSSADVDQLVLSIASEARRLRFMLASHAQQRTSFDLSEAIRSAILMTRSSGVVVRDEVPTGLWVHGCRDHVAQVVLALLDNARIHAAPSPIDLRATWGEGRTTLYVEDRGPGITRIGGHLMFRRGRRGAQSSGSGLGLCVARRLMADQAGSLKADSRQGGGASFAMSLPSSPVESSEGLPRATREPVVVR